MRDLFLGVDVGSVSAKLAGVDGRGGLAYRLYLRTHGQPIRSVQEALRQMAAELDGGVTISGVGATGSARQLASVIVGADVVKNEVTCHAVGALQAVPDVATVLEIGGQDSKLIIIRDGLVVDFAMNTVCAAGTGAFLDAQAQRLAIPIEQFGQIGLGATTVARIAGRCTVFAESDIIHKQQLGTSVQSIIAGLHEAVVRNYLSNLGRAKQIRPPVVFQGGVAANAGVRACLSQALNTEVVVPPNHDVMGAIGAALLVKEQLEPTRPATRFKGFSAADLAYSAASFDCGDCQNACEVTVVLVDAKPVACWGDRCGKWGNDVAATCERLTSGAQ